MVKVLAALISDKVTPRCTRVPWHVALHVRTVSILR